MWELMAIGQRRGNKPEVFFWSGSTCVGRNFSVIPFCCHHGGKHLESTNPMVALVYGGDQG